MTMNEFLNEENLKRTNFSIEKKACETKLSKFCMNKMSGVLQGLIQISQAKAPFSQYFLL